MRDFFGCRDSDNIILTNPTTIPPKNADQKPLTLKPRLQLSDSHPVTMSISALSTSVNSPSVSTIKGQVSMVRRGRSVLLTIPKTAATSRRFPGPPLKSSPGISAAATQSAAAFRIQ